MTSQHNPQSALETISGSIAGVKSAIKRKLKIDAGHQNALDVAAAAHGYKDYQTVKGLADKDHYTVRTNLGTRAKPLFIELDLGNLENAYEARKAAEEALANCEHFQKWDVLKNGKPDGTTIRTAPEPERGLEYHIVLNGDTMSDIELALEEVGRRIDNREGFDSNETGSFSFERSGEEYDEPDEDEDEDEESEDDGDDVVDEDGPRTVFVEVTTDLKWNEIHPDDRGLVGRYAIEIKPGVPNDAVANAALDAFHLANGIKVLEDFEIAVLDAEGNELAPGDGYEDYEFEGFADYLG